MTYIIEKNVPFTPTPVGRKGPRPGGFTATCLTMEVGDSFAFPGGKKEADSARSKLHSYCKRHNAELKFTIQSAGENTNRIWRVK